MFNMKSCLINFICLFVLFSFFQSCENKLEMTLPQGPQGEKGEKGDPGLSAFDLWKEYYGKDSNASLEDFFNSLKGKDGKDGAVPVIGGNNNWWIDGVDTGILAKGTDGKNGVTPEIGSNGNWYIDGVDTGVPARGVDGIDGKDGLTPYIKDGNWWIGNEDTNLPARGENGEDGDTPTVQIGPGPNYYWIINGVETTISAKGKDGVDGKTPVIGDNGNWYIGGEDTDKPSVMIPYIKDGNWWIGGEDTGKPARGPKGEQGAPGEDGTSGVDGKTSYELWKEAVNKDEMTNKDGSPYTGGDSWEEFLRWLQGGDVSVLHQYWLKLGNSGDINEFIDLLFSCHCDGITVNGVQPYTGCVELNADGSPKKYEATVRITSEKAGTYTIKVGEKVLLENKNLTVGLNTIKITQTSEKQILDIICTISDKIVTKNVEVPALKYLSGVSVSVEDVNESSSKATITLTDPTAVSAILVDTEDILVDADALGWTKSADGKTYIKEYARAANKQPFTVSVKGKNDECTALKYEIPSLTPVGRITPDVTINNDCFFTLKAEGTQGMTVIAKAPGILPADGQALKETSIDANKSLYSIVLPRKYAKYVVTLTAMKEGFGNVTASKTIEGELLLQDPLKVTWPDNDLNSADGKLKAEVRAKLENTSGQPITVTIKRGNTASGVQSRTPWISGDAISDKNITVTDSAKITIEAGGAEHVIFQRDFRANFTAGNYKVTLASVNGCEERKEGTEINIPFQQNYRYGFEHSGGIGGPDPNGNISFVVKIYDALPDKYIQFQLPHANGALNSVIFGDKKTDAKGNYTGTVTMAYVDFQKAVEVGIGHFIFSNDEQAKDTVLKSEIVFEF